MAKKSKVSSFGARKNKKRDALIALQKKFNQVIPTNQVIAYIVQLDEGYRVDIKFLRYGLTYEATLPSLDVSDHLIRTIVMDSSIYAREFLESKQAMH